MPVHPMTHQGSDAVCRDHGDQDAAARSKPGTVKTKKYGLRSLTMKAQIPNAMYIRAIRNAGRSETASPRSRVTNSHTTMHPKVSMAAPPKCHAIPIPLMRSDDTCDSVNTARSRGDRKSV